MADPLISGGHLVETKKTDNLLPFCQNPFGPWTNGSHPKLNLECDD